MKIKKLEEFSKDGFVAYMISMMHPEIIVNNLAKATDGTEWLEIDVMSSEDESLFPVKVMRMESPNGFVLLTTEEYEIDLAFQLGQIYATDLDMSANETFGELLKKIKGSSDDLRSKLSDIKVKSETTAQNLEEVVKNLRGAI